MTKLNTYDAGCISDFGGGNVTWWQGYLRQELTRAHEYYSGQVEAREVVDPAKKFLVAELENSVAKLTRDLAVVTARATSAEAQLVKERKKKVSEEVVPDSKKEG